MTDQNTAPLGLADAIEFMDSAAVMLGRGEMPAPGTEYAAKWYLAHEALISQAREAERMRGAWKSAREALDGFRADRASLRQEHKPNSPARHYCGGAEDAYQKAVWIIDQAPAPATGGGE